MPLADPTPALPTPAAFHILLALAEREQHGYAIMREAAATGFRIGPGTLYGTIRRLIEGRLIEEVSRTPQPSDDARRRYYRLTEAGRRTLGLEASRMAALVQRATSRGVLAPPEGVRPAAAE